jgi:hypothetical protein
MKLAAHANLLLARVPANQRNDEQKAALKDYFRQFAATNFIAAIGSALALYYAAPWNLLGGGARVTPIDAGSALPGALKRGQERARRNSAVVAADLAYCGMLRRRDLCHRTFHSLITEFHEPWKAQPITRRLEKFTARPH